MALHVKGMPAAKRKCLASIMGDLSNEEDEDYDKGPDAKAPRVVSPKATASGGKGPIEDKDHPEVEVPVDTVTVKGKGEDAGSDGVMAGTTSSDHSTEHPVDEQGKLQ
jgi:hypothetical protein